MFRGKMHERCEALQPDNHKANIPPRAAPPTTSRSATYSILRKQPPMFCLRPATTRSLASCKTHTPRCKQPLHHPQCRWTGTLVPRHGHHDDTAYLRSLNAVTLGPRHDAGYTGRGKHCTKAAQDLLRELGLTVPLATRDASKAYDPLNTFPDRWVTPAARVGSEYFRMMEELRAIEVAVLDVGRALARRSKDPYILRRGFRKLFDHCQTARDVYRIIALACIEPNTLEPLQHLSHHISSALYRARVYATDRRIYSIYYRLIQRLLDAGLKVDPLLYNNCVRFAARSRDLGAMQKALLLFKMQNVDMGFRTFRAIVAKFSIGANRYGEIRNGTWERHDLLAVLSGFEGTESRGGVMANHHLESFLKREQWTYLQAWIQILAHCGLGSQMWKEWLLYKNSNTRANVDRPRRDEFWVAQMLIAGDTKLAWYIFEESGLELGRLREDTRSLLVNDAPKRASRLEAQQIQDGVKEALFERVEKDLGYRWQSDGEWDGWHVVTDTGQK